MKSLNIFMVCAVSFGVLPGAHATDSALGQQWASAADSLVSDLTGGTGLSNADSFGGATAGGSGHAGALRGGSRDDALSTRGGAASSGGNASDEASADSDSNTLPDDAHGHAPSGGAKPSTLGWQSFLPGSIQ